MSILAVYDKIKDENKLYKLTINNKIQGIRAQIYDWKTGNKDYYDFSLSFIRNKEIQQFINSKRSLFQSIELVPYNNMYLSKAEIEQGVVIKEFTDSDVAEKVLSRFIEIYK